MIVPNICQMTGKGFCPVLMLKENSRFPPIWTRFCMSFQFRKFSSTKANFFFFISIGKHILRKWRIVRFWFHFLIFLNFLPLLKLARYKSKIKITNENHDNSTKIFTKSEIFKTLRNTCQWNLIIKTSRALVLVPFLITDRLKNCAGCCQMLYLDMNWQNSGFFENNLLLNEGKVTKIILTAKQP